MLLSMLQIKWNSYTLTFWLYLILEEEDLAARTGTWLFYYMHSLHVGGHLYYSVYAVITWQTEGYCLILSELIASA